MTRILNKQNIHTDFLLNRRESREFTLGWHFRINDELTIGPIAPLEYIAIRFSIPLNEESRIHRRQTVPLQRGCERTIGTVQRRHQHVGALEDQQVYNRAFHVSCRDRV